MKRAHLSMVCGAIALLVAAVANAEAPSAPPPETAADTARVESAGEDGGLPARTAVVPSADYDPAQRPAESMPGTATRFPVLLAASAGALAMGGLFLWLRSQRTPPV
jgi:hypothetical protein